MRKLIAAVLGAALPLGILLGAHAFVEAPDKDTTFPRTAQGLTYGSELEVEDYDQRPDLISAIATNGRLGYVQRNELDGASQRELTVPVEIPVYDIDGEVIGAFEVSVPSMEGAEIRRSP